MISEKIMSAHHAMGELAGRVPELEWGMVRLCRSILEDCAEQVQGLEEGLEVPREDEEYALTNIQFISPEEWRAKQRCGDGSCECSKMDVTKEEK